MSTGKLCPIIHKYNLSQNLIIHVYCILAPQAYLRPPSTSNTSFVKNYAANKNKTFLGTSFFEVFQVCIVC